MRSKTDFYRLFFEQLARRGFDVKRSQSSDYIADIYFKSQLVAYFSKADTVIQNPFVTVKDKLIRLINDTAQNTANKAGICRDCPYTDANEKLPNGSYKLAEYNGVTLACKEHHLFGYVFSTYRTAPDSGEMIMQGWSLERKIRVTQTRIMEWYMRYDGQVFISFSGGKDSTVLLDLARRVYPDIPAVYVDTGLEYPELRDFVKTKDNVIWLRPRYPFTQILEKYGYPIISKEVSDVINGARKGQPYRLARLNGELLDKNGKKSIYNCENYKYLLDAPFKISARCCYHMKKAPLNKFERQSGRHPITGVLACESKLREQSWIKFGCNGFERQRPLSQPLAFWLEEDILRYLKMTGIPYAPIYGDIVESRKKNGTPILKTTGVFRSGCMYCMYGVHLEHEPNRFQLMQVTHPQQYDYCINKLGCGAVLDYIGVPYRNQQLEVDHC